MTNDHSAAKTTDDLVQAEAIASGTDSPAEAAQATNHQAAGSAAATELPAMPVLTPEEAADLRAKAREAEAHYDRYLRALADFENFRKRVARDREETDKYRHEPLLRELLPVLDGLDLAFAAPVSSSDKSAQALKAGFVMINQQLRNILRGVGLEEIEALGKPFDPKLHDAIGRLESTEVPEGHVFQEMRKGYKYRDRLLRPASVWVAGKPEA